MRRYFTVKKVSLVLLTLVLLFAGVVYAANAAIERNAAGKTFDRVCDTPHFKCALLLGTSKTGEHGDGNAFFAKRIKATVALFDAGKINCVIVSGDNSRKSYDEPTDMKLELIKKGVDSTKIYMDCAGFRTFDSMVRCKEVFGQTSVLVISQRFHNERAIYIGEYLGMKVSAFNAEDVGGAYGRSVLVREVFARVKVFIDLIFGAEAKFLGEKIIVR